MRMSPVLMFFELDAEAMCDGPGVWVQEVEVENDQTCDSAKAVVRSSSRRPGSSIARGWR